MDAQEDSTTWLLVCWVYHSKVPQTREPKEKKFIFSQFWRLKVQDQAVGRFFQGLSPDCRLLLSFGLLFVRLCDLISSYKG